MRVIEIPIKNKEYNVYIEDGLLNQVEDFLDVERETVIITDDFIPEIYLNKITSKLQNVKVYKVPHGEHSKSMETANSLINSMISDSVTRGVLIIALGGGVVGDLVGFVASIYMRGVDFIQIPTSLLAQIDSSVGGKVAVNADNMKNAIGSFYQPKKVLIDVDALNTLEQRQFNNGVAEIIKTAYIAGKGLKDELDKGLNSTNIIDVIASCIEFKRDIVVQDVEDRGIRQILNYGHTIGHAIEQAYNYKYLHGEAIAIGMQIISAKESYIDELCDLINKYELPVQYSYDQEKVYDYIKTDKKVTGDTLNIILVKEPGKPLIKPIRVEEIKEYL